MTNRRRVTLGLADQGVIAVAGAGNGLLATAVLPVDSAGVVLVSIATVYVAMGITRAFIGDILLAHVSRFEGATRRRMYADAAATAVCCGAGAAVLFALAWLWWPNELLDPLIYVVPFIPSLLLHDTARYAYQSQARQDQALIIDLVWVAAQASVVIAVAASGRLTGGWLLAAWGIGASAGAITYLLRSRIPAWRGRPRRWLAHTRHLSGWFTGTALIGQTQTQLIAFMVPGLLGPAAFAGLRLAQLTILQPVQNFVLAMMGLLVPRSAVLAGDGDTDGLRRQTRTMAIVGAIGAGLVVITVTAAAGPLLAWYRDGAYVSVTPLALPVALQAGIYLLQIPFTAAVRGMQLGSRLFAQYALFTITSLTGAALGARFGDVTSAAWGLTGGATVGLAAMVYITADALKRLPKPQLREAADSSA